MNLLINATPAKKGGAKTILENYLKNADFSEYKKVFLCAPKDTKYSNDKIKHISMETKGLYSWFFSVFGVSYFALKYKCKKIISFNNVNLVVPFLTKITYFHNLHIFQAKTIRFKLLRFTIKYLMKNQYFVFQTNYVLDEFINIFGRGYKTDVNWCGCEKPNVLIGNKQKYNNLNCIVPIVDSYSDVKNFKFIVDNAPTLTRHKINVNVVAPSGPEVDGFNYLGTQSKIKLFELFGTSDFMIMPSLFETVGLPIFEFASTGKPVLVLNKPYIQGIDETVGLTKNIIVFEPENFDKKLQLLIENYDDYAINELSEDHPLVKADWSAFT